MTKFLWATVVTIVSSIAFSSQSAFSQFTDSFSDGNFSLNPVWAGSDSKFTVNAEKLQLTAPPEAGNAFLSTNCVAINTASWEFSVNLQFNPSGSNYTRVYLTSDQPDLSGPVNGYYVLIGSTADDISLFVQTGPTHKKIIDGVDSRVNFSLVDMKIKVLRSEKGDWELFSDVGVTDSYMLEGVANDLTHISSSYFGIYCTYTSTRSDKFFFDDFEVTGQPFVDNTVQAVYKDVIFTEIFADPTPSMGLPEAEFVEIFNTTSTEFNLNNWTISDGTSTARIGNTILLPGEYLIVVPSSSVEEFSFLSNAVGVSGFPSLNNTADAITIKSQQGVTIDSIRYADTWYKDSQKREGGWSLEIIDVYNPCGEEENWIAAEIDEGGTPGRQNSVFANKPDVHGPSLIQVIAHSPTWVELIFNEKLANEEISLSAVEFNPPLQIDQITFADNSLRALSVALNTPIQSRESYTIIVENVRDCSLNLIEESEPFLFALPEKADSLDVVINEILFDPWPTGVDFIELYNRSSKYLNLKNWSIANWDEYGLINPIKLSEKDLLISPGSYIVVTTHPNTIIGQYPLSAESEFLQSDLPSLPDHEGSVAIVNEEGKIVDATIYTSDFHSPLIKSEEGVSLERVSSLASGNDGQNWKSASTKTGYATPGFQNSNRRSENLIVSEPVTVLPEIFQPVFGLPNFTEIIYKFERGGFIANVKVYDGQGRLIKTLANNDVLGTEGFYRWDGDKDDGFKARTGYYFVWFEVFDVDGVVRTFRNRIIVAGQL